MRSVLRHLAYCTTYKRVRENMLNVQHIRLEKANVGFGVPSSNPILSFCLGAERFYFRPCPKKTMPKDWFREAAMWFTDMVSCPPLPQMRQKMRIDVRFSPTVTQTFRVYMEKKTRERRFLKRLARADTIGRKTDFSLWEEERDDVTLLKAFLMDDVSDGCQAIALYFLWYMRGVAASFRTRHITCGEQHVFFRAVRTVASAIVAEELGLSERITPARFCRLEFDDGQVLFGVCTPAASGVRMCDGAFSCDGSVQKTLLELNVLDLLCVQPDHAANNCNLLQTDGKSVLCAFDNDHPSTFLPIPSIRRNFLGCSPIADRHGRFNRPYFGKTCANALRRIDRARLKKRLRPYLNAVQIAALNTRIRRMRRVLEKTEKADPTRFLSDGQWNAETVAAECSGAYGQTYLTLAANNIPPA